MQWFYAKDGQQAGPVDDAEFQRLAREGLLHPTTLVWREGMEQWEPLVIAVPPVRPPLPQVGAIGTDAPSQVTCAECGQSVSTEETVQIGATTICAACKPNYVQKLREGAARFAPAGSAAGMRYAGFWIRVAALVIDGVIISIVTLPLSVWLNFKLQQALAIQGGGPPDFAAAAGYWALSTTWSITISTLYGWLFVGRYAATPGKMLVKIKVVTENGGRVSYLRALGRQGGQLISSLTCMIGYLLPLFNDEKRALHDYICKTRVIYK